MRIEELLALVKECPLVASVQASEGSPLEDPQILAKMAQASASQGVKVLRAQGVENIRAIKKATGLPVIGLIKRKYPDSEIYITPTLREVEELLQTDCEIIAFDATQRARPENQSLVSLIQAAHKAGRLAMADCDNVATVKFAAESGADLIGTTLSGYTPDSKPSRYPDLEFIAKAASATKLPVLAEGRISNPRQAHTALRLGANGFVVGGALNDPVRQTASFVKPFTRPDGPVAAFDIGGTWLRFGLFSDDWKLIESEKIELPKSRELRLDWIRKRSQNKKVARIGIGSGGTVEPISRSVIQAKGIIPEHVSTRFSDLGAPTIALNDGLTTAWGHACLPQYAGMRVATLALGTGIGCGFVDQGRLLMGPQGQTLKLNDLPLENGISFEEELGGAALSSKPSKEKQERAIRAAKSAIRTLQAMCLPEVIVVCGGVGMSEWLDLESLKENLSDARIHDPSDPMSVASWVWPGIVRSPFRLDAGLYGAAALALYPPVDLAHLLEA